MQKTPDFMPEFKAQLPRTSHVLSHDFGFSATTAHLLPVFHTVMNPGETIKLGFDFNLRTMPLQAAAFGDLICHTEYFFVPMQLLYQPFDSVYYGITDQFSSQFGSSFGSSLPVLDFDDMISQIRLLRANAYMYYPVSSRPIESVGQNVIRLLDMLGYNPIGVAVPFSSTYEWYNPNVFPYPILAYNCIYQYYYRLDARENFNQASFNWDQFVGNALNSVPVVEQDWSSSFIRLRYRPLDNDYFTDIKVSPIVDVLNLNSKSDFQLAHNWLSRNNLNGNSFKVLSSGSIGDVVSHQNSGAPTGSLYRNPSTQITTEFGFGAHDNALNVADNSINGQDINTANIRALFANEKLWSITGRAKKNYDDQTLAHFGFKVPHDVKHQISCFGHDTSKIHIGEVISTADTTNAPLGEIAGKGYGSQSGSRHSFTAPCHGVVMAIFSVVVNHNYDAGILKANLVSGRNDFYVPEFDHLGMQPLFYYETWYFGEDNQAVGNILGWQYRYEQWKRRYNRVTGVFRNTAGSLSSWIPSYRPYYGDSQYFTDSGKYNNLPNTNSYQAFLNFPTDVNQIMLGQYPTTWSSVAEDSTKWASIYDFDPFVVNSHIDAVLVSSMSDYSLPRLDA